jgi:hypothetical protein
MCEADRANQRKDLDKWDSNSSFSTLISS